MADLHGIEIPVRCRNQNRADDHENSYQDFIRFNGYDGAIHAGTNGVSGKSGSGDQFSGGKPFPDGGRPVDGDH